MSSRLIIDDLANHPHYVGSLAKWYHQAFSHLTGELTIEQRQQFLNAHIKDKSLPVSFIAINHQQLLGGVCLVESDIESHTAYTPWLSRIFVHRKARGQSVATRLIEHSVAHIKNLGYENLYLLTEHKQLFFSDFGFEEIDKTSLNGFPLSIMMLNLK